MGTLVPILKLECVCSPSLSKCWATAKDWIRHKIAANAIRKFRAEAKEELDRRLAMLIVMRSFCRWHTDVCHSSISSTLGGYYQFHWHFFTLSLFIRNCHCSFGDTLSTSATDRRRDYYYNVTHWDSIHRSRAGGSLGTWHSAVVVWTLIDGRCSAENSESGLTLFSATRPSWNIFYNTW